MLILDIELSISQESKPRNALPRNLKSVLTVDELPSSFQVNFSNLMEYTLSSFTWINSSFNLPNFLIFGCHFRLIKSRVKKSNCNLLMFKFL
mmetsp:Transcript_19297/g.28540  ORF Transcript_19297/g.28540 Transcript_19297/m.28540 type:complete len:92 (-) Transcript_19297:913-1188(-)